MAGEDRDGTTSQPAQRTVIELNVDREGDIKLSCRQQTFQLRV